MSVQACSQEGAGVSVAPPSSLGSKSYGKCKNNNTRGRHCLELYFRIEINSFDGKHVQFRLQIFILKYSLINKKTHIKYSVTLKIDSGNLL